MNWLDILLVVIIGSSVLSGVTKGLARVGIGVAAVVLGTFLGIWFYGIAGSYFLEFVSSRAVANFLGFLLILLSCLILGGLLGALLARIFKWAGLSWLDRVLGGAFGLLRGVVISVAVILIVMAFSVNPPPSSVVNSRISPYVVDAASVLAAIAPKELKDGFWNSYDRVKKAWSNTFPDGVQRPPTSTL